MKKILLLLILASFACKKEKDKEIRCYDCEVIVRRVPQPYTWMAQIDTSYYMNCNVDTITEKMEGISQDANWYTFRYTTCTLIPH